MKFAQKIKGKFIPKKQGTYLQVLPRMIPSELDLEPIEVFVEKQLQQEELNEGIEFEVDTYVIDFRKVFL